MRCVRGSSIIIYFYASFAFLCTYIYSGYFTGTLAEHILLDIVLCNCNKYRIINRKTNKTPRADLDCNGNMLRAGF